MVYAVFTILLLSSAAFASPIVDSFDESSIFNRVALITIAIGDVARQVSLQLVGSLYCNHRLYTASASLRALPLYILTDADGVTFFRGGAATPQDAVFAHLRPVVVDLESLPRVINVTEESPIPAELRDMFHLPPLANSLRMRIKSLKASLFDYVDPQFDYLLYLDSDMIIGKDLTGYLLNAMIRASVRDAESGRHTALTLFPDLGNSHSPYHTGTIMMHRAHSKPLLRAWKEAILSGNHRVDQKAIVDAVERRRAHALMRYMPHGRSAADEGDMLFAFIAGDVIAQRAAVYALLHVTEYRLRTSEKYGFARPAARQYCTQQLRVRCADSVARGIHVLNTTASQALLVRYGKHCRASLHGEEKGLSEGSVLEESVGGGDEDWSAPRGGGGSGGTGGAPPPPTTRVRRTSRLTPNTIYANLCKSFPTSDLCG